MNIVCTLKGDRVVCYGEGVFGLGPNQSLGGQSYQDLVDQIKQSPDGLVAVETDVDKMLWKWDESEHPRIPAGETGGGEFTSEGSSEVKASVTNVSASPEFAKRMDAELRKLPQGVHDALGKHEALITYNKSLSGNVFGRVEISRVARVAENLKSLYRKKEVFQPLGDPEATLRHEIGHLVDNFNVGDRGLKQQVFDTFNAEKPTSSQSQGSNAKYGPLAHYFDNRGETFAEAFSAATGKARSSYITFGGEFPKTVEAMKQYIATIK